MGFFELPFERVFRAQEQLDRTQERSRLAKDEERTLTDGLRQFQDEQPSSIISDFQPSPSPSGIFSDRIVPPPATPAEVPQGFQLAPSPLSDAPPPAPPSGIILGPEEQRAQDMISRNAMALLNANPDMEPEEAVDRAIAGLEPALADIFAPEPKGGLVGRFERGLPKVAGAVGKGISAVDEAAFQVNKFINEQLGTPPSQQPTREEFGGVLTPRLTEGQVGTLRKVLPQPIEEPVVREVEALSTPAGLATMLAWPTFVLKGAVGGIGLAAGARAAGAPEAVEIGAQVTGNILAPGAGLVPELSKIAGGLRGTQATAYVTRMTEEITTARSAAAALREAGLASKADELERFAEIAEGALARAEGRATVATATGDVIGEGALAPTRADVAALQAVRATTIGDVSAPEFAQAAVRADVPATGETISSQVLQPRPQTGPAILETRLPQGAQRVLADEAGAARLGGEGIPRRLPPEQEAIVAKIGTRPAAGPARVGELNPAAYVNPKEQPQGAVFLLDDGRLLGGAGDTPIARVIGHVGIAGSEAAESATIASGAIRVQVSRTRAGALELNIQLTKTPTQAQRETIAKMLPELDNLNMHYLSPEALGELAKPPSMARANLLKQVDVEISNPTMAKVNVALHSRVPPATRLGAPRPFPGVVDEFGRIIGEQRGGGLLPDIPERLLPQGGIPGGFQARPRGMRPGAKVTGLSQEGEQIEGTLIQAVGEKAIIRDAAGNVRPVSAPTLLEEAAGIGIRSRLQDIGRSLRFGPSPRTAVPGLDASVQKFVRVLRTAKPTQRSLKAERAQELARRAARGRVPFEAEALSPEEALRELRRAQKGKLPEPPEFEVKLPSGEKGVAADAFTQDEVNNFINIARFSPTLDRELFTRGNIIESLMGSVDKKGILFGRLPTPGELKQLERVYGAEFARELQKLRPFGERFWSNTLDALNIPRTLLAAFDLSFPFRQGVFAIGRHPKEFFGNLPAMLRAAKNPEFAEQMVAAIKADRTLVETAEGFRPLNELAEEARLFLPSISGTEAFEARAEEFLSQLARRVPGVGFAERGFIAYGDKLRSDIFRNTLQSWARQNKPGTADEIADLGMLLNVLTGRGDLPPQLAKALSFGFFAPRFASARPQFFLAATLNNLPGVRRGTGVLLGAPGQTSRVAQLATQELVTSVGMGIGILTLAKMSGVADVELNPLSSDFGKMKIGKTRVDFWGGARPWATVIARMIMGKKKTSTGFVVPQDVMDSALAFGRSKLSPPGAITVDVIVGETAIGEPIGTLSDIGNRAIPLAIQDVKDAVEQEGLTQGFLSTAAFLGVGVQTYETPGEKFERVTGKQWEETPSRLRDEIIRKTPELADLPERLESDATRIRAERSAALLPQARSVLQGVTDAGVAYNNIRDSVMPKSAGAAAEVFRGLNITPKGRDNELLAQYYDVDFQADHNNDGNFGDSDDVRIAIEQQESTKSQMSKDVQEALDNPKNFFPDPDVVEVERMRDSATDAIDKILELPKWSGLSLEEGDRLDEAVREVRAEVQMQKQQAQQMGIDPDRITFKSVASGMARRDSSRVEELTNAYHVSSGRAIRAQERMDLALENRDVLLGFFPNFIGSVLPAEVERGELTEGEFRQLIRPPTESAIGVLKR